jgi:signal transduction histidine kinase/ActR/RegA family two-component response regulator
VVRTGESEVVERVTDQWFARIGAGPRLVAAMKAVGIVSIITVPLRARDRIIGALSFASSNPDRRYHRSDLVFAEDLGGRCAMAIENAGLFRQVEEMNRSKDEFIAMLGHELRNPLAAISNALVAAHAAHGQEMTRFHQVYEEMRLQIMLISRFVDDLLDVTRISHGMVHLRKAQVDLADAVFGAAEGLRAKAEAKGQAIDLYLPDEPVHMVADPVRLHQILTNLLQNAIKYTQRGGNIQVSAAHSLGWVSISVRDNGIGMPEDLVARVFDPFSQAKRSLDRSEGGIGIGLALVRRLVEMHGGTVEAFSSGPRKGSEFVVRLPVLDKRAAKLSQESVPADMLPAGAGRRLLLADDNEFAVRMLAQALEANGHDVTVARDGVSAVRMASELRPNVAVLDIGLPGIDGYEVARRLRLDPDLDGIRLVAVTGYGGAEDRRKSREAGFDEHLVKPVDFETLERLLQSQPG